MVILFSLSRRTTVVQDLFVRHQFSLVQDNRTNVNVEAWTVNTILILTVQHGHALSLDGKKKNYLYIYRPQAQSTYWHNGFLTSFDYKMPGRQDAMIREQMFVVYYFYFLGNTLVSVTQLYTQCYTNQCIFQKKRCNMHLIQISLLSPWPNTGNGNTGTKFIQSNAGPVNLLLYQMTVDIHLCYS